MALRGAGQASFYDRLHACARLTHAARCHQSVCSLPEHLRAKMILRSWAENVTPAGGAAIRELGVISVRLTGEHLEFQTVT